jgi:hypothetical protein
MKKNTNHITKIIYLSFQVSPKKNHKLGFYLELSHHQTHL